MIIFMRLFTVYRTVKGQVIIMEEKVKEVLITKTQVCRSCGISKETFELYKNLGYIKPVKKSVTGKTFLYSEDIVEDVVELVQEFKTIIENDYYTIKQAAELLGIHPNSLRIAVQDGRLKASTPPFAVKKSVYYKREDVEKLAASMYL